MLDFLRKTNADGQISVWLKKKHAAQGEPDETLEDFAVRYKVQGEKVVAAECVSRLSDRHYGQWLTLHKPFRRCLDLVDEAQLAKVPPQYRYLAMAYLDGYGADDAEVDRELKVEGHSRAAAQSIRDMLAANLVLIQDYLAGRIREAPEPAAAALEGRAGHKAVAYNSQQRRFKTLLDAAVARSLLARSADEGEAEAAAAEARASGKVLVCMGPPGTGKTTVCHDKIEEILGDEGKVLFALPTAQLASRTRERYGRRAGLEINTCHAAFALNDPVAGELPFLLGYDLVVVDEISQLSAEHGDRIIRLWEAADCAPALVFVGDRWQMAGYGERRPWESARWKVATFGTEFFKSYRCQDPAFEKLLSKLRTAKPDEATLKELRKRKAWAPPGKPTAAGVHRLLRAHPNTTIVSCTRAGAEEVNACAIEALFGSRPALVNELAGDVETNPRNYVDGILKPVEELAPLPVVVHKGMSVYLTKNIRKDVDFVNGMSAEVLRYNAATKGLRVRTKTGFLIKVWPWSDPDHGGIVYYPLRPGYCSTILKLQGAELDHITAYLDAPNVPGAAYTAISRVRRTSDFLIGGAVTALHFTPAH